jgi:hypothetical protein
MIIVGKRWPLPRWFLGNNTPPVSAPQIRGVFWNSSASVANPAHQNDADLLCIEWVDFGGGFITLPSGFTLLQNDGELISAYKVEGASPPASYTSTETDAFIDTSTLAAYSGVNTTTPVADSDVSSGAGVTATAPSLTTAVNNSKLVIWIRLGGTGDVLPVGMTTQFNKVNVWYVVDQTIAIAGVTGVRTATQTFSGWRVLNFALSPP